LNLARGAVRHPVAVLFFTLAVFLGGLFSYSSIEMESFPEFTMAQVRVITNYPGAAPAELESLVTVPIETRLKNVKDIKEVYSSSKEGQSVISITFNETIDINEAVADVKRSIQEVTNSLPDEATDPFVMAVAMSELPVITLSIIGNLSPNELKDIAELNVKAPLLKVSGVGDIDVIGGTRPCFEVIVDQQKLRRYNLALSNVSRAIQSSNLNMPGGKITYGDARFLVRTIGAFKNVTDIGAVPVDISRQPPVVVSDVAEVSETFYPFEGISRLNGKSNVSIHIKKSYGENILKVAKDCHVALRNIEKSLPSGVTVKVTADLSEFVEDQMSQVKMSALLGGLLAVFVLYVFLRKITTTAIIALSIPMSILITLSVMYAYGYSLNYLSLAGMILALGMLVDDSIVVLENIVRHHEMGKSPVDAAIEGSTEIASPVLVSTITTVIVFAPVFLMSDWGPAVMLKHMAFSLVVAVSASYVVAMVVVPCASSILFSVFDNSESDKKEKSTGFGRTYSTRTWYVRLYLYSLGILLRNPVSSLVALGLVFVFSFFLVFQNGFKGNMNISSKAVTMYFRFEEGAGKAYKEKVFDHFEQIVLRNSDVTSVNTWTNEQTGSGQIMANLGIRGKEASVTRIKDEVRSHFGDMAGVTVTFQNLNSMLGVFPVSVSIKGTDMALMSEATQIITRCLRGIKGLATVENTLQSEKREVLVEIDRRRSAIRKVSEREIASTVRTALFGNVATRVVRNNRETDVIIKMDSRQAGTFRNLGDIFVFSTTGEYVPLREVADIKWSFAVPEIVKADSQQIVKVNADVEDESKLGPISEVVKKAVNQLKLPKGVFVDFGGKAKEESKSQTKMLLAFFFSIFLVYGVMTIQFASFLHAFIIIAALPLALIGSNFSLYFSSVQFDVMAAVGIILLAGVVVNDSIVLVDYINQLRASGYTLVKAIVEAGLVRLRPILITSLTTIFGVLPMAFGIGHGAEVYVSLGITLVGGLTFSTILTLGVIPLVYMVTEKVSAKVYNVLSKLLSYLPY
jgi:HAE1 family hydrophobic/amphiphilic exporter-1